MIRGGISLIMAAAIYFFVLPEPIIWLAPLFIAALVVVRWSVRPADWDGEDDSTD